MIQFKEYSQLIHQLKAIFSVDFIDVDNPQFGLEATSLKTQPTIIINAGFISHLATGYELFCIYALHEIAHFYGFSNSAKLISKVMINETWADYWAVTVGLPFLIPSEMERKTILKKAILQLRHYYEQEKPLETRQLEQYHNTGYPEIHLPISLRIQLFESLLHDKGFPDFVIENRRKPH